MRTVSYSSSDFLIDNDIFQIVQARCRSTSKYISTRFKSVFRKVLAAEQFFRACFRARRLCEFLGVTSGAGDV